MNVRWNKPLASVVCGLAALCVGQPALAQAGVPSEQPVRATFTSGNVKRDTLIKLMRPITIEFNEQRLEDVIAFIRDFTTAQIDVAWMDDKHPEGLDKDATVTLKADGLTALALLERVLDQSKGDFGENTWQLGDSGELQIGPKERLNKQRRVEIYDINDLLMEIPDYPEVPAIDLQQALQSNGGGGGGGGGGGQSPFRDDQQDQQDQKTRNKQDRADEIKALLTELVEPEQWVDNGGNGATMRYYQGHLIVNAPDYVHRQIVGYPFWPSRLTHASNINGRRYVTLTTDNGISKIDGFEQHEVSAVVNGHIVKSGPPGGGR